MMISYKALKQLIMTFMENVMTKKQNNKISQAWASEGKGSVNSISLLIYDSLDFRFFAQITAPLDVSRNYKISKYLA